MLVARLGGGKRWQGKGRHGWTHDHSYRKLCSVIGIAVASIEHHAPFANAVCRAAQQPPKLPRDKQADVHVRRRAIGEINAEIGADAGQ